MIRDATALLDRLRIIHGHIRDAVVTATEQHAVEQLAAPVGQEGGDTIFAIDRMSEAVLLEHFGALASSWSFVLIAEGLGADGRVVLPPGTTAADAELRIIVDPIDGTRGLMYQKRPAWILTGVAPNRGESTTLADIELAIQTEIPLVKQHLSDALWVLHGNVGGERFDRVAGKLSPLVPRPSRATTIEQGYGGVARFFPGGRDLLAAVDDGVVERVLGVTPPGCAPAFEDQYVSTGGQLYELMMGHDRWIADVRPLLDARLRERGRALGIACHPYDICTESIARACGVVVCDEAGSALRAPLDVSTGVTWIGFANTTIRDLVAPALLDALREHRLIDAPRPASTMQVPDPDHFFARDREVMVAVAPGRLDVMGGIADYSGSLVLELPLGVVATAAVQRTDEPTIVVRSSDTVTIRLEDLQRGGGWLAYDRAREFLNKDPRKRWIAYIIGTLVVLGRERGLRTDGGLRIRIDSSVPMGKGVASSAAIEVATMRAVAALYNIDIGGRELGILAQMAENLVVGAPCGVMDQMTAACGEENRLLALLCQPAQIVGQVALPPDLELWGIDSGIRHEIGGADYGAVRVGAFMGYRIVADLAGLPVRQRDVGSVDVDDFRWRGYLANLSPDEWRDTFRDRVPERLRGAEFLAKYGGITDRVTRVDPKVTYAVRQPAEHPIMEHDRVRKFRELLERGAAEENDRRALGALMFASHASYTTCGLGSSGTDRLVELVRASGDRLYGAKITGGGSGGTVAVLARAGSRTEIERIAGEYNRATGRNATVLGGSSPGAIRFGAHRATLA